LWIGTEIGLVKMNQLTGRVLSFYGKRAGLPKDTVTAIYSSDGKELWIGTDKNGLFRMNTGNDRILKYSVEGGILENSITTITGKGNQVWVGTKKGLYNINSGTKKMIWYTIAQGLPHNYINSLFLDKDERLWITTNSNTLTYIQDGKVTKMPLSTSAGILTLAPVTEDRESRIWVGSKGNGIFLVESDSVVNFTTKEGLLSNYCYSLFCDNQNYIWIGHKDGLSRISTTDFSVKPIQHIEDISGDFQFNPNAISKDQSENILFGSDKGLISYNPSKELPQLEAPVLVITSIRINGIEKEYANNKIILSPGNYKLRIDFLGVSLKEPTLVTYQYKLEGSDQWSEITKNTSFTNDHLTDGEYAFILKASSGDGVVTDNPLAISIIVKKPIWKKLWFYAVDIITLTLLIFFYVKWRFNRLIAEKRILEEKVIVRTQEIQSQKNEIELQRDMIEDKNANITSSIRYARHIQKAVLPPWEMINKLLPENFVLNKPKDIVSGDFYWLTEKDNKIIFTVADCTGHGVPGAFMSLLGITLLNEIVNIHGITRSDAIVTELRQRLIQSLQQNRKDVTTPDGMDIALCVLDQQNNKLQFTGGMNDLVYIHDGKIEIIRADLVDVSASYINYGQFTVKEINYKKGDLVYLFSDGYQDQFGGDYDRKFLRPHFYNALFEVSPLPLKTQREFLEKKLNKWMKNTVQTDDITVMGVRL
jgi:serine phosphatase RsbU (regulator of sigma subunit)